MTTDTDIARDALISVMAKVVAAGWDPKTLAIEAVSALADYHREQAAYADSHSERIRRTPD